MTAKNLKIKKGDTVTVISGKDRGRVGKVLRVLKSEGRVVVEGVNLRKRHLRPRQAGKPGQIVDRTLPIRVENVMVVCAACGRPVRVRYQLTPEGKDRVCARCGTALGETKQ